MRGGIPGCPFCLYGGRTMIQRSRRSALVGLVIALLAAVGAVAGRGGSTSAADAAVSIVDFAFTPSSTTVTAGSTVRWTHNGNAPHTVSADNGLFDSGRLASGGTFAFTFPKA